MSFDVDIMVIPGYLIVLLLQISHSEMVQEQTALHSELVSRASVHI